MMRRRAFLAFLTPALLGWVAPSVARIPRVSPWPNPGGNDPATTAWVNAVVAAGGTVSSGRETLVNDLIVAMKNAGVWSTLDCIWLLAAENTQSALIDLKSLIAATATNTPTFTTDQGYAGNGSTSYINIGFNMGTAANYAQNSSQLSVYVRNNRTTGSACEMGIGNGATFTTLQMHPDGTGANQFVNSNGNGASAVTTAQGQHVLIRTGATSSDQAYYNNGVSKTVTGGGNSSAVHSLNAFIGAFNNSGTANQLSADQIAMCAFGSALNATQAADFSSIVNTYMTAIGANVY